MPPPSRKAGLSAFILILAASPALLLFVTVPLDISTQVGMGVCMILLMLLLGRLQSYTVTLILIVVSVAVSTRYLYWRTTQTLVFDNSLEAFLGTGLYLAEVYVWMILTLGYFQTVMPLKRAIRPLPEDLSQWPTVDVYIPTYNESLDVVQDTVLAAQNIDYPADKLRVYLLDDGRRPEFGAFAAAAGVGYITRSDNRHAKAGNLNNALSLTDGELICIFDCDHVSTRAFLQATVGAFLQDARLALVQTPHHFHSPDPFERNLATGREVPNEGELFYGPVQQGNDFWNAAFFCGSCAVIRRSALEEIGGFAVETVTEDSHTALKLQRRGWNTAFLPVPLAAGLATERLALHIGQRMRWARGMTQIFRLDNPLLGRGLRLPQRLCYLNALLHYQFALPRIVFLTAPTAYLLLGQNIIAAPATLIFAYMLPHMAHSIMANARIQGRHRHSFWGELYETVLAFHILKPTLVTLFFPKRGKFNVTDKGELLDRGFFDFALVRPHLLTAALLATAIAVGLIRYFYIDWFPIDAKVLAMSIGWALFSLLLLLAASAVAMESRQLRSTTRLTLKLPVVLHFDNGRSWQGETLDISMGGLKVVPAQTVKKMPQPPGQLEYIEIACNGHTALFPAHLMGAGRRELRLSFSPLDIDQRRELVRIVMGRADAWLASTPKRLDRPLRSLWSVAKNALTLLNPARRRKEPAPATDARTPQERAGQAVPNAFLLLLLCVLCLIAAAPLLAGELELPPPSATAQPPAAAGLIEVLRFEQLGIGDGTTLRGARAEVDIPFSIGRQQIVSEARLDLHVRHSDKLPADARLEVLLNGETLDDLRLTAGEPLDDFVEIAVNPLLLLPHNSLRLRLRSGEQRCESPERSPLQIAIGKDSSLSLELRRLPLTNDLALLPAPFFDEAQPGELRLPTVLAGQPGAETLRSAALAASHFGALARYRSLDFPVTIGTLPLGNALLFALAEQRIDGLQLPPIEGPTLAMLDNPRDPHAKLLLIAGRTPAEQRAAALALVLGASRLKGASMLLEEPSAPPRRAPYDAPRWLPAERPVRLAELTDQPLASQSPTPAGVHLNFHAAPDNFLWGATNIPMHLRYRFPEGDWLDASRTHLDIALNGRHLASLPMLKGGPLERLKHYLGRQTRQEEARVEIPAYLIYGDNRLDFHFNLRTRDDPDCSLELPEQALSRIDGDSSIDLSGTRHFARLPNLSFFVGAGFPFTRMADLSETAVLLPGTPREEEIEAMLGLLGRFGEATGYPALGVEVLAGPARLSSVAGRDLLAIGRLDGDLALAPLLAGSDFRVEKGQLRIAPWTPLERVRRFVLGDWDSQAPEAARQLAGDQPFRGLLSRRSPFDPARALVLVLAREAQWLPQIVESLHAPEVSAEIRGDLTHFASARQVQSFRVGTQFAYGTLPWHIHVRWLFSDRPALLATLLLASALLVALALQPLLRARAARRLSE
ncbi:UDP-forming cellulose synthase catalytic subunit [Azotobacter vinelandii]|uniref:UDP-forming cellulose synthase catalytic subunit n=1 Tax=Azotobacter vinelandii TaxID=354 RepID=UPI0007744AF5|nr:UDP-forming cellulose synthase catalytic subunit [Azotobacter vinelandii]WKN22526.1 UDP-forming cellulose synthase catalytic subunit [Azotobacter vinelandii]